MLELAKEYGCPIRYPLSLTNKDSREFSETAKYAADILKEFNPRKPDVFFVNFYDETATKEQLLNILDMISDGSSEIMCHPGHVDEAFAKESVYNFQRARELQILTDLSMKDAIEARGIKLITFAELK
jgi:predicted glycoside hydrolase/deacetylase ChbG (UPF0249 family)